MPTSYFLVNLEFVLIHHGDRGEAAHRPAARGHVLHPAAAREVVQAGAGVRLQV